jgi:hypothetical protein
MGEVPLALMRMEDRGGNLSANVTIQCVSCGQYRNIRKAQGGRGGAELAALPGPAPASSKPSAAIVSGASQGAGRRRVESVVRPDRRRVGDAPHRCR